MLQENKHYLAPVYHLLSLERKDLTVVLLLTVAIGFLNLATPLAVQTLVNLVTMGGVVKPLVTVSFILFILLLLSGFIYVIEYVVVEYLQRRLYVNNVLDIARQIQAIDLRVSDEQSPAELVNRYFELSGVQKSVFTLLTIGLSAVLHAIIGSIVLIFYSFYFTIIVIFILLAAWFIVRILGSQAIHSAIAQSYAKYHTGAWLESIANNANLFKFTGGENYALKGADKLAVEYLNHRHTHFNILLKQNITGVLVYALAGTVMLGIGGWLVMQAQINLGQFVAAELIIFTVLGSFVTFVKKLESYYDLVAGLDKLEVVKTLPTEPTGAYRFKDNSAFNIEFKNLSYQYDSRTHPIKSLSLKITAGEQLAILGGPGIGKTTLSELITGLRMPTDGHVLINGIDLRLCHLPSLRQQMELLKKVEIQQSSVLDNLQINNMHIDLAEINQVLARLNLLDTFLQLPDGIETKLNVLGAPLSGIQVRLLVIARAVIQQPHLLIIDGLLDELDSASLKNVIDFLTDIKLCTLIVMTRDIEIAKHFSRKINLADLLSGEHPDE